MLTLSPKSDHRVMMKQIKTLLAVSLATGLLALSAAETDGFYLWKNGKTVGFYSFSIVCENDAISLGESIFNVNDIDSITFINPDEMGGFSTDTVFVNFDGQTAEVYPAGVDGISTEVNRAAVTLTNTNTDRGMVFVLKGESAEGSFTYIGTYKACICLSGVSLKSATGAALDIKCGKRIGL